MRPIEIGGSLLCINKPEIREEIAMTTTTTHETFAGATADDRVEIRDGYADVGDVRLHYVEAGEGPMVVLLHGFPEFWYGWRLQIQPLAAAGFRVVAPDLRRIVK